MAHYILKREPKTQSNSQELHMIEKIITSAFITGKLKLACEYLLKRINSKLVRLSDKELDNQTYIRDFYSKFKDSFHKMIQTQNYDELISSMKILKGILFNYPESLLINEKLDLLNNLGLSYHKAGRVHTAKKLIEKGIGMMIHPHISKDLKTSLLLNMCSILSTQGNHEEALLNANRAKFLAKEDFEDHRSTEKSRQVTLLAVAYHNAGVESEHLGHQKKSIDNYKMAVEILKKYGESEHSAMLSAFMKSYEDVCRSSPYTKLSNQYKDNSFSVSLDTQIKAEKNNPTIRASTSVNSLRVSKLNSFSPIPKKIENAWDKSEDIHEIRVTNETKPPLSRSTTRRVRGGKRPTENRTEYSIRESEDSFTGSSARPFPGTIVRNKLTSSPTMSADSFRKFSDESIRENREKIKYSFPEEVAKLLVTSEQVSPEPYYQIGEKDIRTSSELKLRNQTIPTYKYEIPD